MIKLEKKDQAVGKTNDNIRNTNQIKEKSKGKNNSATKQQLKRFKRGRSGFFI